MTTDTALVGRAMAAFLPLHPSQKERLSYILGGDHGVKKGCETLGGFGASWRVTESGLSIPYSTNGIFVSPLDSTGKYFKPDGREGNFNIDYDVFTSLVAIAPGTMGQMLGNFINYRGSQTEVLEQIGKLPSGNALRKLTGKLY